MKITFLGAGDFGQALSEIVKENGHEVKFYDPIKYPDIKLEDSISGADVIIFVAPSSTAPEILPKLPKDVPLICASKGFLSLKPFAEFEKFSALGGAAFAKDIISRTPRIGDKIVLTASSELSETLFSTEEIQVEYTKDTLGILICGALKNIYATSVGIAGSPSEKKIFFIGQEMARILEENSADTKTFTLSCGLNDLVMSITSNSRNTRFGREIRRYPDVKLEIAGTIESVNIVKSLSTYNKDFKVPDDARIFNATVKRIRDAIE